MTIQWDIATDPATYVLTTLQKEADDIPIEKIKRGTWVVEEVPLDRISVDLEMIADHDSTPLHNSRRDSFVELMKANTALKPLIVLGESLFLVDGYARYRALKLMGVYSAQVYRQTDI